MTTLAGPVVIDRGRLPTPLADASAQAIARLAEPETAALTTTTDRTRRCESCGSRVTLSTDGTTEWGHQRENRGDRPRCPERPDRADPTRECGPA